MFPPPALLLSSLPTNLQAMCPYLTVCDVAMNQVGLVWLSAAKGHTSVLQAALEAVRLGTKESIAEESDDTSMKQLRAWSKLMKDSLNQRGSRGETPLMVACEEGLVPSKFLGQCVVIQKGLTSPMFPCQYRSSR